MGEIGLRKGWHIVVLNIRHFALPHIGLCLLLFGICHVLFGSSRLDSQTVMTVLQYFAVLTGVLLLTPLTAPEQTSELEQLMRTKATSYAYVLLLRAIYSLIALSLLLGGYGGLLYGLDSAIELPTLAGTLATAVLLGGLSLLVAAVSHQVVAGYMSAAVLYMLALFAGERLGVFQLFATGKISYTDKLWHAAVGLACMTAALIYKSKRSS